MDSGLQLQFILTGKLENSQTRKMLTKIQLSANSTLKF